MGRDRLIAASGLPEWYVRGFIKDRTLQRSCHDTNAGEHKGAPPKNEDIAAHMVDTGVSRATAYRDMAKAAGSPPPPTDVQPIDISDAVAAGFAALRQSAPGAPWAGVPVAGCLGSGDGLVKYGWASLMQGTSPRSDVDDVPGFGARWGRPGRVVDRLSRSP